MHLLIRFQLTSPAFGLLPSTRGMEASNILRSLAMRLDANGLAAGDAITLKDTNGRAVGLAQVMEKG
jgi:hypothetical protein